MTFADSGSGRRRFGLGDALQATFDAVGSNFVPMYLLALLLVGAPYFLLQLASGYLTASATQTGGAGVVSPETLGLTLFAGFIVYMVTALLLQAALVRLVVVYLNGGKPQIGECLAATVRVILPLIGISIVAGLAIMAGLIVLIIPGIFLAIAWSLAGPVEVIERRGVFGSLARSFNLTDNHRWMMVGVFLIIGVVNGVINLVGGGVATLLSMGAGSAVAQFNSIGAIAVRGLISALLTSLGSVLASSAAASLYVGLRQLKEGATPKSLAAVFD